MIEFHEINEPWEDRVKVYVVDRDLDGTPHARLAIDPQFGLTWVRYNKGDMIEPVFTLWSREYYRLKAALTLLLAPPTPSTDLFEFVKAREQEMFAMVKAAAEQKLSAP